MPDLLYDNEKIKDWASDNLEDIKKEYDALGIKHRPTSPSPAASRNKIVRKIKVQNGMVQRISYGMPRTLIYVHKGVGKGRGIKSGRTTPKPWYTNPTNRNLPKLEDIVAEAGADFVINNLSIK